MYEEKNIQPEFMKRGKTNPFRAPDHYFDSIEDRVMEGIKHTSKNKTNSAKVFRLLLPALGLAACFSLVYLLVFNPMNNLLPKATIKTEMAASISTIDDSTLNFSSIDENTLVNAIFSDETSNVSEINPDEMLAYLSSGMNEVEIYSEIQN